MQPGSKRLIRVLTAEDEQNRKAEEQLLDNPDDHEDEAINTNRRNIN